MGLVKSKLIKNLANQYPNFYSKDLTKIINIFIEEIKIALKNGERVELRDFATFSIRKRKSRERDSCAITRKRYKDPTNKRVQNYWPP